MDEVREHRLAVRRTARVLTLGDPRTARSAWIVLHGYGQLARAVLEPCAALARDGRLIVAPEALSRFYVRGAGPVGASWMTREERDAEIGDQIDYLDRVAEWLERDLGCAADALCVLGFSQGAAAAWRWAALGRARVARVVGWGGEIPPDVDLAAAAPRLRAMRATIVHGARDALHTAESVARDVARAQGAGIGVEVVEFDGAHAIDAGLLARIVAGTA